MSRYDGMSPRAQYYVQNWDEIDLAEMAARSEAHTQQLEDAIARVRALHVPSAQLYGDVPACRGCEGDDPWTTPGYPCPTIVALEPPKETHP